MDKETNVVEKEIPAATQEQPVLSDTVAESDMEAKFAQLEAEKNKAVEEAANYKLAFLKEKNKKQEVYEDPEEETEDERIARIVAEKLAESKIAQINKQQEDLLKQTLKENKELKLSQLNKTKEPPAFVGGHSEGQSVQSTSVTPEQLAAFKARGWTDKEIERYKKNLARYR